MSYIFLWQKIRFYLILIVPNFIAVAILIGSLTSQWHSGCLLVGWLVGPWVHPSYLKRKGNPTFLLLLPEDLFSTKLGAVKNIYFVVIYIIKVWHVWRQGHFVACVVIDSYLHFWKSFFKFIVSYDHFLRLCCNHGERDSLYKSLCPSAFTNHFLEVTPR